MTEKVHLNPLASEGFLINSITAAKRVGFILS